MRDPVLDGVDASRRVAWAKFYQSEAEKELLTLNAAGLAIFVRWVLTNPATADVRVALREAMSPGRDNTSDYLASLERVAERHYMPDDEYREFYERWKARREAR